MVADWDNSRYRASELSIAVHRLAPHLNDDIELVYLPIELGNTGAAFQSLAVSPWYENRMRHENAGQTEHILVCGGSCFSGALCFAGAGIESGAQDVGTSPGVIHAQGLYSEMVAASLGQT